MGRWSVLLLLCVSQFVMILDSTVMNVSISTVASDLGTTITGMQAAITFYALTMAAFMLTGGKLGDRWGRARAFRIGAVVYGLGSLTTALSPNLTVLMLGWSLVEGLGAVLVIPAIADLAGVIFAIGMFIVGSGFGLLASQLGNVNMSAVSAADTSEVGGLQGTFQNLGSSFGTALVGSVFILLLTSGFTGAIESSDLPSSIRQQVVAATETGTPILSQAEAEQALEAGGATPDEAAQIAQTYAETQVASLRQALFLVFALAVVALMLSRGLPREVAAAAEPEPQARGV